MAKDALGTKEEFSAEVVHADVVHPDVGADLRVGPSEKGGHTGTPLHEPTVRFARADGAPAQRVVHGDDYARDFIGAGPWQATEQEWDLYLKNTGAFKKV